MQTSILRKLLMALSGIFLIIFLLQHLVINLTSIIPGNEGELFNSISHFMGYNPIVQFVLQPILIFGVCFHFVMGFILEIKNRTNQTKYAVSGIRSSWASKNMIFTGLVVLSFLALHFCDFFFPEIDFKYIESNTEEPDRYFNHLVHAFKGNIVRTLLYCISFIFLGLHLVHGFSSSFETMGLKKKYIGTIRFLSKVYAFIVTAGFIAIAIIHYFHT